MSDRIRKSIVTPYDNPERTRDRIAFPLLRRAYVEGLADGWDDGKASSPNEIENPYRGNIHDDPGASPGM